MKKTWFVLLYHKRKRLEEAKMIIICILEHEIYDTKSVVAWIHKSWIFHATRSLLNLELVDSMQKHELCHLDNDNKRAREWDGDIYAPGFCACVNMYTLVTTRQWFLWDGSNERNDIHYIEFEFFRWHTPLRFYQIYCLFMWRSI